MESVDSYGGFIGYNEFITYYSRSVPELVHYKKTNTSFNSFEFEISTRISNRRSLTTNLSLLKRLCKLRLISL